MKKMDEQGESLIADALALTEEIGTMRRQLERLEDKLETYFLRNAQVEAITCATGSAQRVIYEEVFIEPSRVAEAMAMLGDTFPTYFTSVNVCRPTPAGLEKLRSADSRLGHDMRDFLIIRRERFYSFSPGRRIIDVEIGGRA